MNRWRVIIEVWPYSTGRGNETDQKAAGEREPYFYVSAENIEDAFRLAKAIQQGIEFSPHVWRAPIFGVHKMSHGAAEPDAKPAPATKVQS